MIVFTGTVAQDYIFDIEVKRVTDIILADYAEGRESKRDIPDKFSFSIGLDGIDKELIELLRLEELPEGTYESQVPYDFHYTITLLPDSDKRLYVLYDVRELELPLSAETEQFMVIVIPAILTAILGIFLGLFLAGKVIRPVQKLADRVRKADPDVPFERLEEEFTADEIGELAGTIEAYSKRLSEFIIREKEFTRNVSHELRTPLAVVKNGAELLDSNSENFSETQRAALGRIERSAAEMERLVTTFLILAREKDISGHFTRCSIGDHVDKLVEKYNYLLVDRDVDYKVKKERDSVLDVPAQLLDIILANMVRNAFQYASDGTVEIFLKQNSVKIVNQFTDETDKRDDFAAMTHGVGHSITSRLCEHLGYTFSFIQNGFNAVAIINFSTRSDLPSKSR
jgi:signal transduction histidine kinase